MTHPTNHREKEKKADAQWQGVRKGHVALFCNGVVLAGDCRWEAIKTQKKGGDVIFTITLIKPL